jgi:hypothetical protein
VAKLSVPLLARAFTVPVRVSVQLTVFVVVVGLLQVAAIPVGRPEAIATLAPAALAGTVTPPIPVAVTITDVVPIEDMVRDWCDSDIVAPGANATDVAVMPKETANSIIN